MTEMSLRRWERTLLLCISISPAQAQTFQLDFSRAGTVPSAATQQPLKLVTSQGVRMLPLRFIQENMHVPVLVDPMWNIFEIDGLHFKVGAPEMHFYHDKVGGNVIERFALPTSPINQGGRIYVPLESVLEALGFTFSKTANGKYTFDLGRGPPTLPPHLPH